MDEKVLDLVVALVMALADDQIDAQRRPPRVAELLRLREGLAEACAALASERAQKEKPPSPRRGDRDARDTEELEAEVERLEKCRRTNAEEAAEIRERLDAVLTELATRSMERSGPRSPEKAAQKKAAPEEWRIEFDRLRKEATRQPGQDPAKVQSVGAQTQGPEEGEGLTWSTEELETLASLLSWAVLPPVVATLNPKEKSVLQKVKSELALRGARCAAP